MKIKVWFVYVWDDCYPYALDGNIDSSWVTEEEAQKRAEFIKSSWEGEDWHNDNVEVIDMLKWIIEE